MAHHRHRLVHNTIGLRVFPSWLVWPWKHVIARALSVGSIRCGVSTPRRSGLVVVLGALNGAADDEFPNRKRITLALRVRGRSTAERS